MYYFTSNKNIQMQIEKIKFDASMSIKIMRKFKIFLSVMLDLDNFQKRFAVSEF